MPLDRAARDELVLAHAAWARRVAIALRRRLRVIIDADEAIAAANLALVQAADRYQPERGIPFTTYAHRRIEGAVLDHAHAVSDAWRDVAGGPRLYPAEPLPIDAVVGWLRADDRGADQAEARKDLGRLLVVLNARELEVLRLSFVEDMPLAEVGELLGVTESRVCQIRFAALGKLRRAALARAR